MKLVLNINIIGLGPGNIGFLTENGRIAIENSQVIIGSDRHIDSILSLSANSKKIVIKKITELGELFSSELFSSELFTRELFTNELLMHELFINKLPTHDLLQNKLSTDALSRNKLSTNKLPTNELITTNLTSENIIISIIVSGDTGFYSLLDYIMRTLPEKYHEDIEVIPGISSFQYLFGKLKKCWHDYLLVSAHGRDCDYISYLNFSKKGIIILGDKTNNWRTISKHLLNSNIFNLNVTVGMNLSYPNELIFSFNLEEYHNYDFSTEDAAVIIIEKRGETNAHI